MPRFLELYQDTFAANQDARYTGDGARMVYIVSGEAALSGERLSADSGAFARGPCALRAGADGATCWRFELCGPEAVGARVEGAGSRCLLEAALTHLNLDDGQPWLMRLDSVAFPPGGCALLHTHQGPGIRCLLEGTIRIDSEGHSTSFEPGGAWFESGPEPVFAAADPHVPSRFVRTMIRPGHLQGQSSIRYVRAEDRDAPKSQRYRVYAEQML
jgi:hypothetical protein